jgi:exosome complex exonuclease DIS3/RRP44
MPYVLSDKPVGTKLYPSGHYLIPDTNAILTGMDLFEQASAFKDVIILQTVLEEVKNRSLPLYHRLISLTNNQDKRFYVFFNEFRMETYITREAGESINDRNDRAVRKSVQWYQEHLEPSTKKRKVKMPTIVMVSDDKANRKVAKSEGLAAVSRKWTLHFQTQ